MFLKQTDPTFGQLIKKISQKIRFAVSEVPPIMFVKYYRKQHIVQI